MEWTFSWYVALLCIGLISVVGSLLVTVTILRFGHSRVSTRLVFYLHVFQMIQDMVVLLDLRFVDNNTFCIIAGFVRFPHAA